MFTLDAPLEAARDQFADLDAIVRNYGPLDEAEQRGPRTLHFRLEPEHYGVTTFRGEYTCHYEVVDDRTVTWHSDPGGNVDSSGTAAFEALDATTTRLDYRATLVLDIDVNRFLARAVGKVAEKLIEREMRGFLERMIADVEKRNG